jgi:hypothetical protein
VQPPVRAAARLQRNDDTSRPDEAFKTSKAKKNGLANAASGRIRVTCGSHHFGPIGPEFDPERNVGIVVGECWKSRLECRQWGVHLPHVAGIAGQGAIGAQSVILSGALNMQCLHTKEVLLFSENCIINGVIFWLYLTTRDLEGGTWPWRWIDEASVITFSLLHATVAIFSFKIFIEANFGSSVFGCRASLIAFSYLRTVLIPVVALQGAREKKANSFYIL